jgi:hypothetical protein
MRVRAFFRAVTLDRSEALDRFLLLLETERAEWCVVGGLAVNAYVEPVVTLDMDVVIAAAAVERIAAAASASGFRAEVFPHSINLSVADSDLRIQIQTDSRYASFVRGAQERGVLGLTLPVAAIEDVLQGKIWAFQDPQRRASKRQKDLADIARLIEARPELRDRIPAEILERLV